VDLDAIGYYVFHVFGVEVAQTKSADALVLGQEAQGVDVLRIVVLKNGQIKSVKSQQ
jgi:hypothetical protein